MTALKLRPVRHVKGDSNRYCGPSAISAITGMSSGEAARLIRHVSGVKAVKGTGTYDMNRALVECGITPVPEPVERDLTLAAWLRKTHGQRGGVIFLVVAGNHWQIVSGNRYICGIVGEIVSLTHPRVKRRARVARVYRLVVGKTGVQVPKALVAKPKPDRAKANRRAATKRLADRLGVTIERETGFTGPTWWVAHPDLKADVDPREGCHFCTDWDEIAEAVQDYATYFASQEG